MLDPNLQRRMDLQECINFRSCRVHKQLYYPTARFSLGLSVILSFPLSPSLPPNPLAFVELSLLELDNP